MIKSLDIQNYALIDYLSINFDKGLNIVTGETGAGKSIMLGAMGLIMGKRADTKVLFDTDRKCIVEAKFSIRDYRLQNFFSENDLDYADELIIRREINPAGKSRAFINDSPVNLEILQDLASRLVDLHQQFDTLDIQKPAFQMSIIDALSGNEALLNAYQQDFFRFKNLTSKLNTLHAHKREALKEQDFLTFQFNELNEAKLGTNDKEEMEAQLAILENAEEIKRVTSAINNVLNENNNCISDQLTELNRELNHVSAYDKKLIAMQSRLEAIMEEVKDIGGEAGAICEETDFDQKAIQDIQEKLSIIYRLEKKHGVSSVQDLIEIKESIEGKLEGIRSNDQEIAQTEGELQKLKTDLNSKAENLTASRSKTVPGFTKKVETMLKPLSMENAHVEVKLTKGQMSNMGQDDLVFYFSANKGGDLKPLKDVASGGEISRLTLVIKSIVASAIKLPTMIFDEIDSGISGEVANRMGIILAELSKKHQVICITHSPQISAKADLHYFVYKDEIKGRTISSIKSLNSEERTMEIAKMLSGDPPTKSAIENAKELLNP